jgi:hypothetical protein
VSSAGYKLACSRETLPGRQESAAKPARLPRSAERDLVIPNEPPAGKSGSSRRIQAPAGQDVRCPRAERRPHLAARVRAESCHQRADRDAEGFVIAMCRAPAAPDWIRDSHLHPDFQRVGGDRLRLGWSISQHLGLCDSAAVALGDAFGTGASRADAILTGEPIKLLYWRAKL